MSLWQVARAYGLAAPYPPGYAGPVPQPPPAAGPAPTAQFHGVFWGEIVLTVVLVQQL